jgi:hypothetical protein
LSPEEHEELVRLAGLFSPIQLAVKFDMCEASVKRWLARPIGYKPAYGRPKGSGKKAEA